MKNAGSDNLWGEVGALGVPPGRGIAHAAAPLGEMGDHLFAGIVVDRPRSQDALGDGAPGDQHLLALLHLALLDLQYLERGDIARQLLAGLLVFGDAGTGPP